MKEMLSIKETAGKANVEGSLGLDAQDLVLTIVVRHPHAVITDKIFAVADAAIDKVEAFLPGDQKEKAAAAKAELRNQLVELLGAPEKETPAEPTPVEPVPTSPVV